MEDGCGGRERVQRTYRPDVGPSQGVEHCNGVCLGRHHHNVLVVGVHSHGAVQDALPNHLPDKDWARGKQKLTRQRQGYTRHTDTG